MFFASRYASCYIFYFYCFIKIPVCGWLNGIPHCEAEFRLRPKTSDCSDTLSRRKTYHPATWEDNFGVSMEQYSTSCRLDRAMLFTEWHINAPSEPVPSFEPDVVILAEKDISRKIDDLSTAIETR